jgi:cytochrome c5
MRTWTTASAIAIALVAVIQLTVRGEQAVASHGAPAPRPRLADHSIWDSVFTAAQAARGDSIYKAGCVTCHGDALQGATTANFGDSAPLVGAPFMATWDGQTLAD